MYSPKEFSDPWRSRRRFPRLWHAPRVDAPPQFEYAGALDENACGRRQRIVVIVGVFDASILEREPQRTPRRVAFEHFRA
jgi:hypothetical protein